MQVSRPVVAWLMLLPVLMMSYYVAVILPEITRIQSPNRFGDILVEMGANMKGLRSASCDDVTLCVAVVTVPSTSFYSDFEFQWSRKYDSMVYSLADAAHRLGGSSCVRSITHQKGADFTQCSTAKNVVLLGSHLLKSHYPSSFQIPSHVVLYNTELVETSLWFAERSSVHLIRSHTVWDFSPHNIKQLNKLGVDAKYIPVGYADGLTFHEPPKKKYRKDKHGKKVRIKQTEVIRDIDVLLVGSCNTRRSAIVTALSKRGLVVKISTPLGLTTCSVANDLIVPAAYGRASFNLLRRAKIILNTHYFETGGILEVDRIVYYLANSLFVVSEVGHDEKLEDNIRGGVVLAAYDDIVDTCVKYLGDSGARSAVAAKGYVFISQLDAATNLRCPLFGTNHVVNIGVNPYTSQPFPPVYSTRYEYINHQLESFMLEFSPPSCFRVVAVMVGSVYNSVLVASITDLINQGIDVYYVSHSLSDAKVSSSIRRLQRLYPGKITNKEMMPMTETNSINEQLRLKKAEIVKDIRADWIIDVMDNELIESPWGNKISVRRALYVADSLGYNLINFGRVLNFIPGESTAGLNANDISKDFKRSALLDFYFSTNDMHTSIQVKGWKTYFSSCPEKHQQHPTNSVDITLSISEDSQRIYYVESTDDFSPQQKLCPFSFISRQYPTAGSPRNDNKDAVPAHRQVHRCFDNGHLPMFILSSFLPCR